MTLKELWIKMVNADFDHSKPVMGVFPNTKYDINTKTYHDLKAVLCSMVINAGVGGAFCFMNWHTMDENVYVATNLAEIEDAILAFDAQADFIATNVAYGMYHAYKLFGIAAVTVVDGALTILFEEL
jgi:hypothetical protein